MNSVLEKSVKVVSILFFTAMVGLLFLVSLFSTTILTYGNELFYLRDRSLLMIADFLVIIFIIVIGLRVKQSWWIKKGLEALSEEAIYHKIKRILLYIILIVGMVIVFAIRAGGRADDRAIQEATYSLLHGDFSPFLEGGYINRFPFNIGYLTYSLAIAKVFGTNNYIVIQILNVLFVVGFYREMTNIFELYKMPRVLQIIYLLTGILFYPLLAFSCFAYGMIPGLYFSILSVKTAILFFRKPSINLGIVSVLTIIIGSFFKNNYYIFLLGIFVVAFTIAITRKNLRIGIFASSVLLSMAFVLKIPSMVDYCLKDYDFIGQSTYVWIYYGMIDGERGPGWCSDVADEIFFNNPGDKFAQDTDAKSRIFERIGYFKNNPSEAFDFYFRKIVSQWNCPSFDPLYVSIYGDVESDRSEVIWNWLSLKSEDKLNRLLDLFQPALLFGVLLYIIYSKHFLKIEELLIPIIFVGGFLFHLIWEARCMYTLPYYILLFPMSIWGYDRFTSFINKKADLKATIRTPEMLQIIFVVLCIILVKLLFDIGCFSSISSDNVRYEQYLQDNAVENNISDGYYYCSNILGDELIINGYQFIELNSFCGRTYIKSSGNTYLCWNENGECYLSNRLEGAESEWYIIRATMDNSFAILNSKGDYLITKDKELQLTSGSESELRYWFFKTK